MINLIDNLLNRITMYRLALYYLIFLVASACVLTCFGVLPFSAGALLYSTIVLVASGLLFNVMFSRFIGVSANVESVYITALILALIISPPSSGAFLSILPFLLLASAWAMASKFIINIGNKHVFNPAALAVALTSLTIGHSASWWVGTAAMLPFVLVFGLLLIRKVQRFDAAIAFTLAALATIAILSVSRDPVSALQKTILASPLVFFASIMLTEPLTMPPTRDGRLAYGILVGALFAPQVHFGSLYLTPELALLVGNVFSYVISPKGRFVMKLREKEQVGEGVFDFVFAPERMFTFKPGQYMEWTLGHKSADSRGNRRYFTIASSPTEDEVRLGVKFYRQPSSYKRHLLAMKEGETIVAGQLAGDFVLPSDSHEKAVFVAGGIGITPFRSMVKYLLDRGERRPIIVLYSNRQAEEIAYREVFDQAERELGIRTVYTITDKDSVPSGWTGGTGHFTARQIASEVPDYRERVFYISGSHGMVEGFKELLLSMGVSRRKIITDFFPGLA